MHHARWVGRQAFVRTAGGSVGVSQRGRGGPRGRRGAVAQSAAAPRASPAVHLHAEGSPSRDGAVCVSGNRWGRARPRGRSRSRWGRPRDTAAAPGQAPRGASREVCGSCRWGCGCVSDAGGRVRGAEGPAARRALGGRSSAGSFPWVGADTHVIDIALKVNELILKCVQAAIEWGVLAVVAVQGGA